MNKITKGAILYSLLNSRILEDPLIFTCLLYSFLDPVLFCESPYSTFIPLSTAIYLLCFWSRILIKVEPTLFAALH